LLSTISFIIKYAMINYHNLNYLSATPQTSDKFMIIIRISISWRQCKHFSCKNCAENWNETQICICV